MYWRFYSLVCFVFLLAHHDALAEEWVPSPRVPTSSLVTGDNRSGLLMPAQDFLFFRVGEPFLQSSQSDGQERKDPYTPITAPTFVHRPGSPSLALPVFVRDLVGPWLPRLTSRDPLVIATNQATGHLAQSPGHPKQNTPLPRLDQIWRVAPVETLAQAHDRLAIDGDVNLGLEVHAGSSKKDRTTNAIKGTASSRFTLLPTRFFEQRFGRYLSLLGKDEETGRATYGQVRLGLTTNGTYALNPSTSAITPTGEVVGSLNWMPTTRDRFTQDPWRVVAFRWYPTVSCEGRSLMGEGKKQAGATRVPLATLTGSLHGDLRLDFLSLQLAASGNYQYRQRLTDTQTKWEQASVSLQYQLNRHVSLGGSFSHGKNAPHQPTERGLALEMGVTF